MDSGDRCKSHRDVLVKKSQDGIDLGGDIVHSYQCIF